MSDKQRRMVESVLRGLTGDFSQPLDAAFAQRGDLRNCSLFHNMLLCVYLLLFHFQLQFFSQDVITGHNDVPVSASSKCVMLA